MVFTTAKDIDSMFETTKHRIKTFDLQYVYWTLRQNYVSFTAE